MMQFTYRIEDDDFYGSGFFPGKVVYILVDHLGNDIVVSDKADTIKGLCYRWNKYIADGPDFSNWQGSKIIAL